MGKSNIDRIVVIGASAAGLRAAARARRLLPGVQITVIDKDNLVSYGACGMPYFISGDIPSADRLRETPYGLIRDIDFFREAKGIGVITETVVERIDRENKRVLCQSLNTGESVEYGYDKLVLALGSNPVILPVVPRESERVTTLKTLHDAIKLRQALQKGEISKVGIVGGGFIGCELAEAFGALWGAEVFLIEAMPHLLPNILDVEMAAAVESYMRSENVDIYTNCPLEGIAESDEAVTLKTPQGDFEVDCAVMAVGVHPNGKLASECGLTVGKRGGIVVDERMTTNDPDIFAAGDCVEVRHLITGEPLQLPLGSLANRQGRVIGSNLGGSDERFGPVLGSMAVKIFDMNVASTGLTEAAARDTGFDAGCAWGTFTDKADYYPESENIHLKLVFDRSSLRLLGLQGYGKGEVVKRVDVFAAHLKNEDNLEDLMNTEFAYAPPYAPAVDPLFSLACAARNSVSEGVEQVSPHTPLAGRTILDVREQNEVESKTLIDKEVHYIPFNQLRTRWKELPTDKPVIIICAKGIRSSESTRILKEQQFTDVVYIGGGMHMKTGD